MYSYYKMLQAIDYIIVTIILTKIEEERIFFALETLETSRNPWNA